MINVKWNARRCKNKFVWTVNEYQGEWVMQTYKEHIRKLYILYCFKTSLFISTALKSCVGCSDEHISLLVCYENADRTVGKWQHIGGVLCLQEYTFLVETYETHNFVLHLTFILMCLYRVYVRKLEHWKHYKRSLSMNSVTS